MSSLSIINSAQNEKKLQNSINGVDYFVRRNYLADLSTAEVVELPNEDTKSFRFFRIDKLVFDKKENANDKLISVYSALQNLDATVLLLIKGTNTGVAFYVGVHAKESTPICEDILGNSLRANFPGSELQNFDDATIQEILTNQNFENICSVTAVPSARDEDKEKFVQGIEKFIDTMRGNMYSAMFISKPVNKCLLSKRRLGLENLYSALSPFVKTTLAYGENKSESIAKSQFNNFSSTINESISNTVGQNWSQTVGDSKSSEGLLSNSSTSSSYTQGFSSSDTTSYGSSETKGFGKSESYTDTYGSSQTFTKEIIHKTAENTLQYIDEQFERIKQCESFGVWETAAYFYSDRIDVSILAANTFKALISGDDTNSENAFLNIWNKYNPQTHGIAQHLLNCRHPLFKIKGNNSFSDQYVTPGNYLSGKELSLFMGLPQKSVPGVTVSSIAEFERNVNSAIAVNPTRFIPLGCVRHMGVDEQNNKINLDTNSFTSHCFITGSTGSGKSNTSYWLLQNFVRQKIPFLVIEPAKGEYKNEFGGLENINIFTTNPHLGAMLKINPFEFNPQIHILEHLDRLIEIFNACWEMYAAMPAILKSAIEKAYTDKGWDLLNSIYINPGQPVYPTFADLLSTLPKIISDTSYSSDSKGDYTGALVTRVQSLTNGITGQIFCDNYAIPDNVLFDENTIIDLSRIGSTETKSLIMGILVMRLSEYRTANANGSNKELCHVTVLEEAHNLLKNVNKEQGQQTANLVGKSVEMICNSIAEMRTYGEGFIIVDQSPTSVDIAAIKNTNTKIVMRLPEKGDCEAIGNSLGLNEEQILELAKLPVGIAAVLQNNWSGTALCHINKAYSKFYRETEVNTFEQIRELRSVVLEEMMVQFNQHQNLNLDVFERIISSINISSSSKNETLNKLKSIVNLLNAQPTKSDKYRIYYDCLLQFSGLLNIFTSNEGQLFHQETNPSIIDEWRKQMIFHIKKLFAFKSDNFYDELLKRLLYAMHRYSTNVDYISIYRALYSME